MAKQTGTGTCAYCGVNGNLKVSYILPKWTIRRALFGSVTGKSREGDNVNHSVQDGEKLYLLCGGCEDKYGKLESTATRAFDSGVIAHGVAYNADFARFLTSIIWRAGTVRAVVFQAAYPELYSADPGRGASSLERHSGWESVRLRWSPHLVRPA